MRWGAVLCALGACIKPDPPVACGVRICAPGSVCLPDGTCAIPPESPTKFTFDNRASKTDLVEMPVLVALDPSTIDYSQVSDPMLDLGFRSVGTDQDVPFEIERWDPTGESLVWTRLPDVPAGSETDALVVDFGPGANRLGSSASMMWKDYELVVHGTGTFESSASPAYPAEPSNVTLGAGAVGDAIVFPSSADGSLTFGDTGPLLDGWSQFSFGFWLYADYAGPLGAGEEPRIIEKPAALANGRLYQYTGIDDLYAFQIDITFLSGQISFANFFIPPRTWTYFVYTYDGQVLRIYRDGTLAGFNYSASPDPIASDHTELTLGRSFGALHGMIDELRITKRTLTPDEVHADYMAQTRQLLHAR